MKNSDFFKLEDRVLFDAAGAVDIAEAAESAENVTSQNDAGQQQEEQNAQKNAPVENPSDRIADGEPQTAPSETAPSDIAGIDAGFEQLMQDGLPADGIDFDIPALPDDSGESGASGMVDAILNDNGETISTDRELVVINGTVPDKEAIIAELKPNQDVLILEDGNGLDELNEYLDGADTKYSAIHLVTHGNDGYIYVNGEKVDAETFKADEWAAVGEHLTDDGDILLYGCNTAESEAGQILVNKIADASGADVAASTDTTGIGGDWDLEYTVGTIDNDTISVDGYDYRLTDHNVSVNANDGAGSLRTAIVSSADGDSISFTLGADNKITLSSTLGISKNITIDGSNTNGDNVILDGNNAVRILYINSGKTVELSNIALQNGFVAEEQNGGAIYNAGTLTISNATFSGNTSYANGGAIYNVGRLTLSNSTFSGNHSFFDGGAIYNTGMMALSNSTFSGNTADSGGAIYNTGTLTISNSTFSGNSAAYWGGAIYTGGNVRTVLLNSILVGNDSARSGSDLSVNGGTTDAYYCLIGDQNGVTQQEGTKIGEADNITVATVFANVDANNKAVPNADGTFKILDKGKAAGAGVYVWHNSDWSAVAYSEDAAGTSKTYVTTVTTGANTLLSKDQIGTPITALASIGAIYVEAKKETPSLVVTTTDDVVDFLDDKISLREALAYAASDT